MLQVISKTPIKFRWEDDLAETVVVIQPDDSSEVIMAKLQRVLELEGHANTPQRIPLPIAPEASAFGPADRAALEADLAKAQPMGWETTDTETLPEYG